MKNNYEQDTLDNHDYHKLPQHDKNLEEDKDHYKEKVNNRDSHMDSHDNLKKTEETLNKLKIASIICLIFMILEVIGGYLANSIAIMSDAAHLLSDFLGFIISIVSIYISKKRANHKMSFGYHRAEVIGALVSVCLIWGLTIWLLFEASSRLVTRNPVNGLIMLITAIIGFVFNIVMGLILAYQGIDHHLHRHDEEEEQHGHNHENGKNHEEDHHTHGNENKHKHGKEHSHEDNDHHNHVHHDEPHNHEHHNYKHENEVKNKQHHELTVKNTENETTAIEEKESKQIGSELDIKHSHEKKEKKIKTHKHDNHDKTHSHSHEEKEHKHDHSHGHSHGHSHDNLNLKAALIHVIGDAVQNLGVVCAGIIIYFYPEYSIADPICTFIFSIIVVFTTIRILKEGISVLMEATPVEIDIKALEKELKAIPHVVEVHDLHVWSLSPGKLSLSCHLISSLPQDSLRAARNHLKSKYKITHSTIQVELDSGDIREDCSNDLHHEFSMNSIS